MKIIPFTTKKGTKSFKFSMTEDCYRNLSADMHGMCIACGETHDENCEPDARGYICSNCDASKVYGIEELLMMGYIAIEEDTRAVYKG